jgi:hypothetical protein
VATLVSTAEYKAWRGISGTTLDTFISTTLGWVSADVRRFCGRNLTNGFESATRTETYSGMDEATILLTEWPITSITSVTQLYAGGQTSLVDSNSYRVESDTGILSRIDVDRGRFASWGLNQFNGYTGNWKPAPRFEEGFYNYSVVYVGGYSTIPADLHMAVCRLTDVLFNQRGNDPSITSESLGQYSVTRMSQADFSKMKMELLAPFNGGTP